MFFFHTYRFFVDEIPITVLKNNTKIGAKYPTQPMYMHGTLWNGTQWLGPTNWSKGPFYANFCGITIKGCSDKSKCSKLYMLDGRQQKMYENIGKTRLAFNYCNSNNSDKTFPECKHVWVTIWIVEESAIQFCISYSTLFKLNTNRLWIIWYHPFIYFCDLSILLIDVLPIFRIIKYNACIGYIFHSTHIDVAATLRFLKHNFNYFSVTENEAWFLLFLHLLCI